MIRVALVVGTRPEAIKLGPVYRALERREGVEPTVIFSGQHGVILEPIIELFNLDRRIELNSRDGAAELSAFAGRFLIDMGDLLSHRRFDAMVVQGDTTSALIGGLAAAYAGIPVAHVEAGLRSHDMAEPFPEELNRKMLASACRWHFAPTTLAAENLGREGFNYQVHDVGNTVVDAALWTASHAQTAAAVASRFPRLRSRKTVLVTAHRRESFGAPMRQIGAAVAAIARMHCDLDFVVPLHPNPNASNPMRAALDTVSNVHLCDPLPYSVIVGLMADAHSILSDSGGLQEEAPTFGVPVLVLRNLTERPEGVQRGCNIMVGTNQAAIVGGFNQLVGEGIDYDARRALGNPYGDGASAKRIADIMLGDLG